MRSWYILQESLQSAYKTVVINKLRTVLSLLGITIGIFAIISVFTVLDSLESNVRESLAGLGDDVIYVEKWPWAPEAGREYEWWKYFNRPLPTLKEYQELKRRLNKAGSVCFAAARNRTISYMNNTAENTLVWGVSEDFEKNRNMNLELGRYFNGFEIHSGKNYAIIGNKLAGELFENENPVGKKIKISGNKAIIIGVLQKEGKSMVGGGSMDEHIVLPIRFFRKFINLREESSNPMIWIKAGENISVSELKDEVKGILRAIRRLKPSADDNFALNQSSMISEGVDQIFGIINVAGWIIGMFSILVGGFGILNIMFVSVRERTNIIGIQRAMGAKRYYIMLEVLYESGILSLLGGIIGLFLIFCGTLIINNTSDFEIHLSLGNIIKGLIISGCVGIIAGLFPAHRASKLNPVEAISTTF
ncbi:MAG: ABC transporter permease [Bacteroidales bacterium]|nr:ABC transporter permease [Bacteroidales bacterium]